MAVSGKERKEQMKGNVWQLCTLCKAKPGSDAICFMNKDRNANTVKRNFIKLIRHRLLGPAMEKYERHA